MGNFTVMRIDDMEGIYGGAFKRARASVGASAFGMQVIDLPPNVDQYPEHDHSDDGQEEVYIVLRGSCAIDIDGERVELEPETIVRVGAGTKRKLYTESDSARILALGGVPGKAYEPSASTELGQPDPLAAS
jgi:mannose-6-phosphate isomerase-like protein (cupin superfamily)